MIDNKFAKVAVVCLISFLSSNQYIFATKVFTTTKYATEDTYRVCPLKTVEGSQFDFVDSHQSRAVSSREPETMALP